MEDLLSRGGRLPGQGEPCCSKLKSGRSAQITWGADSVAGKSVENNNAYADASRFVDLYGEQACAMVTMEDNLKIEGEKITHSLVRGGQVQRLALQQH